MIAIRFGGTVCALLLLTACDGSIPDGYATGLAEVSDNTAAVNISTVADRKTSGQHRRRSTASDNDASDQQIDSKDSGIRNEYVCSVNVWHRDCNWGSLFSEALENKRNQ